MRKQELHPRTAAINQKQKNRSKTVRLEALSWLAATFPAVFDNETCIRPLNLGIMSDILAYAEQAAEAGISKSKLREAVVIFTRRIDYLVCLKAREMRIDLNGNPVVPVTDEEAMRAAEKIKKRIEKSAKSARKNVVSQPEKSHTKKQPGQVVQPTQQEYAPYYPERPPAFSAQKGAIASTNAPAVTIKHKQVRQYDPDAVARLKEKLGLSRKLDLA